MQDSNIRRLLSWQTVHVVHQRALCPHAAKSRNLHARVVYGKQSSGHGSQLSKDSKSWSLCSPLEGHHLYLPGSSSPPISVIISTHWSFHHGLTRVPMSVQEPDKSNVKVPFRVPRSFDWSLTSSPSLGRPKKKSQERDRGLVRLGS